MRSSPRLSPQDWERYGKRLDAQEVAWANQYAATMPAEFKRSLLADRVARVARDGEMAGNTWFRHRVDALRESGGLPLDAMDEDIRAAGRDIAENAYELAMTCGLRTMGGIRAAVSDWARARGIEPPADAGPQRVEDEPALARLFAAEWWIRKLRTAHARRIESAAIGFGFVHRRRWCYVSDPNVHRRADQRRRNAKVLESVEVENQFGDAYTLAELVEVSNANPRIRRGELMTRIAGFEQVARDLGHAAEFITVTCPSRFHSIISASCDRNPRYQDGLTPRDGQRHLTDAWAQCRAALDRRGVRPYGFRIAEPHHDGCPHWHLLLFVPAGQVIELRAMLRRYFLEKHEPHEAGAARNRVKFVAIDWQRGSAAGYVAKYVAKNVDGIAIETDLYGNPGEVTAARVDAWASTWGIRQFQQIGGAPVTVWRELRRLDESAGLKGRAEQARAAADAGDWGAYLQAQGGPVVARDDLTVRAAYTEPGERWCPVAGTMLPAESAYGEPAAPAVWGVRPGRAHLFAWNAMATRVFKWERRNGLRADVLEQRGAAARVPAKEGDRRGLEFRNAFGCGAGCEQAPGGRWEKRNGPERGGDGAVPPQNVTRAGFGGSGRAQRGPWTRVNNCTGVAHEWNGIAGMFAGTGGRAAAEAATEHDGAGAGAAIPGRSGDEGAGRADCPGRSAVDHERMHSPAGGSFGPS